VSVEWVGIVGIIVLLLVLFFLGMPVGFAMAVVGFCGFWYTVSFKAAIGMVGGGHLGHLLFLRPDRGAPFYLHGISRL
jgi:hypothetical protein